MGKNNHASFSSRGKSNLQSLKKKIRQKGIRVTSKVRNEKEKDVSDSEKGGKESKRFWRKWLRFVWKRWSSNGTLACEDEQESIGSRNLDIASESRAASMNIIEIPIDPGRKISKILIRPTRTGIKAMIAQYQRTSPYSEVDKLPSLRRAACDSSPASISDNKLSQEGAQSNVESLSWATNIYKNEAEVAGNNEGLRTSALYIRQDMDKIVESAVFIEPRLPNDYTESRKSDDLSQKSIKINKKRVSYRIVDEENDDIGKTFKTASEPTWVEKQKIFHQQRLHDNISNLLEQFMLLESEDMLGFSIPPSKVMEGRKKLHFDDNSSLGTGEPLTKDISREVSPEVLVNIKPFKEYLSEEYLNIGDSEVSKEILQKNNLPADKKSHWVTNGSVLPAIKSKNTFEGKEKAEEFAYPVLSKVMLSKENSSKLVGGIQTISASRGIKATCYGDYKEVAEFASLECIDEVVEEMPMCTVWGLYKSYSTCERHKGEAGKDNGIQTELKEKKESLDELLENLDDKDHGLIFQKNISQFRKKISAGSRMEFIKPNSRRLEGKKELKKIRRAQNFLEMIKPIIESVTEESEEEGGDEKLEEIALECQKKKMIGVQMLLRQSKCKNDEKSSRLFATSFLLLSKINLVRIYACRAEEARISIIQTLRVVRHLLEENRSLLVKREQPKNYNFALREVHLKVNETKKSAVEIAMSDSETISRMLFLGGEEYSLTPSNEIVFPKEDFSQALTFFSNITECFYVVQTPVFLGLTKKSNSIFNKLNTLKDSEGKDSVSTTEKGTDATDCIEPRKKAVLFSFRPMLQTPCEVAQILTNDLFDYVVNILEKKSSSLNPASANQSWNSFLECDPDTSFSCEETLLRSSITVNAFSLSDLEKDSPIPEMDGFQILYNNGRESLKDYEENLTAESVRNVTQEHGSIILAVEELIPKDESEEEKKRGEQNDNKGKSRSVGEKKIQVRRSSSSKGIQVSKKLEDRVQSFLQHRSNSSPPETITQSEFSAHELRMRRSLILPREFEKDFQNTKKRRPSADKGVDIRRSGSASLESRCAKLTPDRSYIPKSSQKKKVTNLTLPEEVKIILNTEKKFGLLEKKKMFLMEKTGPNVKKEVVAAFNSIKEVTACKGETAKGGNKRVSLVIMLSKK